MTPAVQHASPPGETAYSLMLQQTSARVLFEDFRVAHVAAQRLY
jgi:hypothetical protein